MNNFIQSAGRRLQPFRDFTTKFNNDWSWTFASSLAYSLLMSMLPIAIALISILGFILSNISFTSIETITESVKGVFPGTVSQQNTLDLAFDQLRKNAGWLGLIAVLLAIFGGSRLFIAIEGILNVIYRLRPRPMIRQNLMAFGMLLLYIIMIPIMIITSSAPSFFFSVLRNTPLNDIPGVPELFNFGGIIGSLLAAFILFETIYLVVPNQHISWRNSWRGALTATIALVFFLIIFPFYTAHFMGGYAGQIGFAVILLLFFYYFAVILILGGEVNAFFAEGIRPLPADLATTISNIEREKQPRPPEKVEPTPPSHPTLKEGRAVPKPPKPPEIRKQAPSRLVTALGVVIGTTLAFILEWWRLRHPGK